MREIAERIKEVRDLGVVGAPPASLGGEFALHGRYVEVDVEYGPDGLTVASVYVQTGEAGTDRQLEKERFMAALAHRMATLTDRDAVVCGDWNIAHTENDIKNWRGNVKKSGFLPAERQWLTELLAAGWVDVVRVLHPDVAGPYCQIPLSPAPAARTGCRRMSRSGEVAAGNCKSAAETAPVPREEPAAVPRCASAGSTAQTRSAAPARSCRNRTA